MIKSSQTQIPSENLKDDSLCSHPIDFSNMTSVKSFRSSFEHVDFTSKDATLQLYLKTLKNYFSSIEEMANFLDFVVFDIWEKINSQQLFLDEPLFHAFVFSLSAMELKILEHIYRLVVGESAFDIRKVFSSIPKTEKNLWNTFKYSIFYSEIKEEIENKMEQKKFCLKNNISMTENTINISLSAGSALKKNENLMKLIQELKSERYWSETVTTITVSVLLSVLKNLFEQDENEIIANRTIKMIITIFDLEKTFNWDPNAKEQIISHNDFIQKLENETNDSLKNFIKAFKSKEEEKKMNERLVLFLKNILK